MDARQPVDPADTQTDGFAGMLKHLIEVALPLKEVSEQSARKESIRHVRTEMEKRHVPPHLSPETGEEFQREGTGTS